MWSNLWPTFRSIWSPRADFLSDFWDRALHFESRSNLDQNRLKKNRPKTFWAENYFGRKKFQPKKLYNSIAASDAFFPFADGMQALINAGVKVIIQPGGSIRDKEVIAAANKANIKMVFTGTRHFNH